MKTKYLAQPIHCFNNVFCEEFGYTLIFRDQVRSAFNGFLHFLLLFFSFLSISECIRWYHMRIDIIGPYGQPQLLQPFRDLLVPVAGSLEVDATSNVWDQWDEFVLRTFSEEELLLPFKIFLLFCTWNSCNFFAW